MTRLVASFGLALVAGCAAGNGPRTALEPPPAPVDKPLVGAGARCQGATCSCRPVDAQFRGTEGNTAVEGDPAPGTKRFEFRTGRGSDVARVTIDSQGTLVKDTGHVEPSCGYVDLPPGRHAVKLHLEAADRAQGLHPRLLAAEYGTESKDWYDTFGFSCGADAPCIKDDMKAWMDDVHKVARGIWDKCGTTRVENVRWSVEHSPEQTLEDLTVEFTLHVYKFAPRFKHGTPECRGLAGGKAAEDELAQ